MRLNEPPQLSHWPVADALVLEFGPDPTDLNLHHPPQASSITFGVGDQDEQPASLV